jgi:hypothetical protein
VTFNHGVEGSSPSALTIDKIYKLPVFVAEIQTENSSQHTVSTPHDRRRART